MNIADDVRTFLKRAIDNTPTARLGNVIEALMGAGAIEDRRGTPRAKKGNGKARKPRAKLTCPVSGCKSPFAPRYGGYCEEHRNTKGFKYWDAARKKAKGGKKAAKKR